MAIDRSKKHRKLSLDDNPIAPYLTELRGYLSKQNYAYNTIRLHVAATKKFGHWLELHQLGVHQVDEDITLLYISSLKQNGKPTSASKKTSSALPHLLLLLRGKNVILQPIELTPSQCDLSIKQLDKYLEEVVGLCTSTRRKYHYHIKRFLNEFCGDDKPNWSLLKARDISKFIEREASMLSRHSRLAPISAINSMLRYLVFTGDIPNNMLAAIPKFRTWKHESLPKTLTVNEVESIISGTLKNSKSKLRNHAIVLLLARMGLRAIEVRRLQLKDIDWIDGSVLIRANKTRQERKLPLPQDVGVALFNYLKEERPKSTSAFIFLNSNAPFSPFCGSSAISKIVRRTMNSVGIDNMNAAAHLLRHSAASRMVCKGVSFKGVADVLGHQNIQSTEIYAKLDLTSLSKVALPWPGEGL